MIALYWSPTSPILANLLRPVLLVLAIHTMLLTISMIQINTIPSLPFHIETGSLFRFNTTMLSSDSVDAKHGKSLQ
jgi:hypothetical protein